MGCMFCFWLIHWVVMVLGVHAYETLFRVSNFLMVLRMNLVVTMMNNLYWGGCLMMYIWFI